MKSRSRVWLRRGAYSIYTLNEATSGPRLAKRHIGKTNKIAGGFSPAAEWG